MRNVVYARNAIVDGADILTVTPEILELMMVSELSDLSVDKFLQDWSKLDQDKRYIIVDDLGGKVVVITGSVQGIGLEIAKILKDTTPLWY